ncbi:MAG: hypothetical protein JSV21_08800 [Nitrospirota bacterium]|nr:MAG: hypothetical protein JSV21_08800 [Nitrospirota bacterium]
MMCKRYIGSVLIAVAFIILPSVVFAGKGSLSINVTIPSNLIISVEFGNGAGTNVIEAGGSGTMVLKVWNNGKTKATNVRASISSSSRTKGLNFPGYVDFGTILPGKSVSKSIRIAAGEELQSGSAGLNVVISDASGFRSEPVSTAVKFKGSSKPKLIVYDYGINDMNNNLKVEQKERIRLIVRVKNTGGGKAENVRVNMATGKYVTVCGSGISSFEVGDIRAGEYKDIKFNFYAEKKLKNGQKIPIDVEIFESRSEFNIVKGLDLVMGEKIKSSMDLKR